MSNESEEQPPETNKLLQWLETGTRVHGEFARALLSSFKINGKSIDAVEKEFEIKIPEDLNPSTCRIVQARLMELYQDASKWLRRAEIIAEGLENSVNSQSDGRYAAMVSEHKSNKQKVPAALVLEKIVSQEMTDLEAARTSATIVLNFWKRIIQKIGWYEGVLEKAIMSLGVEAKLEVGDRFISRNNNAKERN